MAGRFVTDGGLETDLIYHHGFDLPEFASFPLLDDERGRETLERYYEEYAAIAAAHGVGIQLDTPTWRANPDWGTAVGYDAAGLDRVNREAVALLRGVADRWSDRVGESRVSGQVGPRGDGYRPGAAVDPDEAADYHRPQLAAFAAAGADLASALTLTDVGEAVGVVRAARDVGLPVWVSFTVETDGRLPDGTSLGDALRLTDEQAAPDAFMVNCAHPDHVARGVDVDGPWDRVRGLRVNASSLSHEELDAMTELDAGDPVELTAAHGRLEELLGGVDVVGGCCGTDASHVAALWAGRA
ncbi:homocysteine S-methyltransferase family protein [Nocardioides aestuarii]|uniref:Homocysteine S-methyltransferase family protein n=1 Tax=Nocardioides aestuarii TaxID=252231 RepID=A0ABW4TKL8_9ACTN